jgi:hypothetical protein
MRWQIGFLLGSGVSLPAAPSTRDLTDVVLNEVEQYYIHSDEEWYCRPAHEIAISPERRERQEHVAKLIRELSNRVERYYAQREAPRGCVVRWCNYEDIGFLADALASTLNRNRDDPGLMPLAGELLQELVCSERTLLQAAEDTVAFVRAVVFRRLIDVRPPAAHLQLVLDAARDADIGQLPIYTLNHNCLLEDAFSSAGVPLFDFRHRDPSGRLLLDLDASIPDGTRATLLKPHGSVRWRRFRPLIETRDIDPWYSEWIGLDRDAAGNRHDDGVAWRSIGPPLILVGRFNKELEYMEAPYWQVFLALAQSLKTRSQLVVSGYGFGDKAINTLLINWLYERAPGERRLIVLHQDKDELLAGARGSIANKWEEWSRRGQLTWIPRFPCNESWSSLKNVLGEIL